MTEISGQKSEVSQRITLNTLLFTLCGFIALLFALCFSAEAQQPKKIPRIGFLLSSAAPPSLYASFREGLRALNYLEGRNVVIEYRAVVNRDRASDLVADLLRLKVDVLVMG